MLVCHGCHRHIRVSEIACPFCGADIATTTAPAPLKLGALAVVVGLSMFACSDSGSEEGEESMTTEQMTNTTTTESGESTDTSETTDPSTADYGGPDTLGDGDPTGDGDGDPTGDGDGDPTTTGDGDGDSGGADYGGAPPPPLEYDR